MDWNTEFNIDIKEVEKEVRAIKTEGWQQDPDINCHACGKRFTPRKVVQKYCGSIRDKTGCSWQNKVTQNLRTKLYGAIKPTVDNSHCNREG